MGNTITYYKTKELIRQLYNLDKSGGTSQKAARRVHEILGRLYQVDPFHSLQVTNHGETRIKNCVKYQLIDGHRLITILNANACLFAFAGSHDSCDSWLEKNKGIELIKNKSNEYDLVYQSGDIARNAERISSGTDSANTTLVNRLDSGYKFEFLDILPGSAAIALSALTTSAQDDYIYDIVKHLPSEKRALAFDVAVTLRNGDVDGALNRIDLYFGRAAPIDTLSPEEILNINDGNSVKRIRIDSDEYLDWIGKYVRSSTYQDWMLFMHPQQERIVSSKFEGPTKLSGVSGSGKTCVVVMRSIHLAKRNPSKPILIVTLNNSLSELIHNLLQAACPDEDVRNRIQCKSFFILCQELLRIFEPDNDKLFSETTWKTSEHVDEVWREFYRCEVNNDAADIFLPIHKSLNRQNINAEEYLRQELDWVRSAVTERDEYYAIERKGRAVPLLRSQREIILEGLKFWEEKMTSVGVIDPLGLASALARHIDEIQPLFSSILVDEVQDFGTLELRLINTLVESGPNDLFLAGDMAQHILPKHQSFKEANILIPGARSIIFEKNYRNSREILKAAYEVFVHNLVSEVITEGDLELLDPQYANFSTPIPCVLRAESLEKEVAHALSISRKHVSDNPGQKACIAIVGFSQFEISKLAKTAGIKFLDGQAGLENDSLFFSDLDQTKGHEFDLMCILNCSKNTLPNINSPSEEHYRDACRFYVAMTRAKHELYLSYSIEASRWLTNDNCSQYFEFLNWDDIFEFDSDLFIGAPCKLPRSIQSQETNVLKFTGKQFIRTKYSRGLSIELQTKLENLVPGTSMSRGRDRVQWKNIGEAYADVKKYPHAKNIFGAKTWVEFTECVENIDQLNTTE